MGMVDNKGRGRRLIPEASSSLSKLFQLLFFEDDKAQLKACEALGQDTVQVTVPLAQVVAALKLPKAAKPVLLTAPYYGETQETSRSAILSQQCKIFCTLLKASEEEPSPGMLLVEYLAKRVYFKKGELVLVSQTDNPSKVGINPPKSPGTAFAEVEYLMAKYYVLAPKPLKQEKDLSWTGSSSCYCIDEFAKNVLRHESIMRTHGVNRRMNFDL